MGMFVLRALQGVMTSLMGSSLVYFCHDGVEIVCSTPLVRLNLYLSYQSATSALYKLSFNPGSLSTNALSQEFIASHTTHSHLEAVQHNRLIGWMCDNRRTLIGWPLSSTTVVSSTLLKGAAAIIKRKGAKVSDGESSISTNIPGEIFVRIWFG